MNDTPTIHDSFTIERTYPAAPSRVFAAWSQREAKAGWFIGPADRWKESGREFDFRVGGREYLKGQWNDGQFSTFDCRYHDIEADRRFVYSYDMYIDELRISVSLVTVELLPAGTGTRLVFTEQIVYLHGCDQPDSRKNGSIYLLDRLEAALKAESAGS